MFFRDKKIFVAGTDTNSGKTFVSVKLMEMYKYKGLNPFYFKPVATGGIYKNEKLVSEDVHKIIEKTNVNFDCNFMNPVLLKTPAAPLIAEKYDDIKVDLNLIFSTYEKICASYDTVIVEGIGGVLVPITKNFLAIDFIKKWNLPVVIVSRVYLGMINHTLLTIKVLKEYNIEILGLIFSYGDNAVKSSAITDSFKIIEDISKVKVIKIYEFDKEY